MKKDMEYDDIIGLEHHVSKRHKPMSLQARAAQFAPFAALTGHQDAIEETARHTEDFAELEEDLLATMDQKLERLQQLLDSGGSLPAITITLFEADSRKSGGHYETLQGNLKQIRHQDHLLELTNGRKIEIRKIVDLMYES